MEERWYCPDCGAEFREPLRCWDFDDGLRATATDLCPKCYSTKVEELEPCPKCGYGWKRKQDRLCGKCELRAVGKLSRFVRELTKEEREYLTDRMEGNGLEMFV